MTPEKRVGNTANWVIFLGILYTIHHLVALLGPSVLAARGFGGFGLMAALAVIGLGYGIRYSSIACLYAATGVFAVFTGYTLWRELTHPSLFHTFRFALSGWALYRLCRSTPAMHILQRTYTVPVRTSRYGEFFLRRWRKS